MTEAEERRECRKDKVPEDNTWKQILEENTHRMLMGSIQDARMLLQHVQLSSDCRQTQEQDEGAGRHRKENAGGNMVHTARQRPIQGLYARYCSGVIRCQYIPHIVRSLYLWCQQPVCKQTNALCGLGRPFELLVRRGNCYIIISPLSLVVGLPHALMRSHDATDSAEIVCDLDL